MRTFQRFPVQQPLEVYEDLLSFVALQTGIDANRLSDYASELDQYREVCAQLIRVFRTSGYPSETTDSDQTEADNAVRAAAEIYALGRAWNPKSRTD